MVPRLVAARQGQVLGEDLDLWVASSFGVDPMSVSEVWPASLRRRAIAYLQAQAKTASEK